MFGDFTFSSGFSQLANLDISQKFEQLKKDLESNISSAIDQDALSALTGEGAKGGCAYRVIVHGPVDKVPICASISVYFRRYYHLLLRNNA